MAKAVPPWLLALIQMIEAALASLLTQQADAKRALKAGCDPAADPMCLSLDALIQAQQTALACAKTHQALCCAPTPPVA